MSTELASAIASLRLVDHHAHTTLREQPTAEQFAQLMTESDRPPAPGTSHLESQIGFAVRRHCAPLLGLARHVPMSEYLDARGQLDPGILDRIFLNGAGVGRWLIDTGYEGQDVRTIDEFATLVPNAQVQEVVRLESVLEDVAQGCSAADLAPRFREALTAATANAVGVKSVIAYRHGFDFDPDRPSDIEVARAAAGWLSRLAPGSSARVTDPVLLRFVLWEGASRGLPVQMHAGYGDPDLDLHRCDPLLLTDWLRAVENTAAAVVLLHCYPYHRHAGYLAQVFPHVYFDVGLGVNYTGAASARVVAEALELTPFTKVLYSSDAWGPSELHYLGSVLWRQAITRTLTPWVNEGDWSVEGAIQVANLIARDNAQRLYGVSLG